MNKRKQEQCEKECKKENQKQFRRIMDDDNPYDDDTGISNKEWLETEAEHDLLLE